MTIVRSEDHFEEYAGCLSSGGELARAVRGLRGEWQDEVEHQRQRLVELLFEPGAVALDDAETMAGAWGVAL